MNAGQMEKSSHLLKTFCSNSKIHTAPFLHQAFPAGVACTDSLKEHALFIGFPVAGFIFQRGML